MVNMVKDIKAPIAWNHIMLHPAVYFHFIQEIQLISIYQINS